MSERRRSGRSRVLQRHKHTGRSMRSQSINRVIPHVRCSRRPRKSGLVRDRNRGKGRGGVAIRAGAGVAVDIPATYLASSTGGRRTEVDFRPGASRLVLIVSTRYEVASRFSRLTCATIATYVPTYDTQFKTQRQCPLSTPTLVSTSSSNT
ncbi:hypothetical protein BZA05DRAFT_30388 [Tricharina praecox]|uniref:uncharacterized protein n=1 Tax=Tricharina praecox TaxID=43433 RepID=UPI0022209073|nr:uncharacterized protein BZA05DRAFT_30388 [Tricharina praecox]KAI5853467.1 hypothetical protein BZA05DRAFT_30388 [Tricharina praecox]